MLTAKQILNEELNKLNDGKYYSPKEMEVYKREAVMEAMKKYAAQFVKAAAQMLDEDYFDNCIATHAGEVVQIPHILELLNEIEPNSFKPKN